MFSVYFQPFNFALVIFKILFQVTKMMLREERLDAMISVNRELLHDATVPVSQKIKNMNIQRMFILDVPCMHFVGLRIFESANL